MKWVEKRWSYLLNELKTSAHISAVRECADEYNFKLNAENQLNTQTVFKKHKFKHFKHITLRILRWIFVKILEHAAYSLQNFSALLKNNAVKHGR